MSKEYYKLLGQIWCWYAINEIALMFIDLAKNEFEKANQRIPIISQYYRKAIFFSYKYEDLILSTDLFD